MRLLLLYCLHRLILSVENTTNTHLVRLLTVLVRGRLVVRMSMVLMIVLATCQRRKSAEKEKRPGKPHVHTFLN